MPELPREAKVQKLTPQVCDVSDIPDYCLQYQTSLTCHVVGVGSASFHVKAPMSDILFVYCLYCHDCTLLVLSARTCCSKLSAWTAVPAPLADICRSCIAVTSPASTNLSSNHNAMHVTSGQGKVCCPQEVCHMAASCGSDPLIPAVSVSAAARQLAAR